MKPQLLEVAMEMAWYRCMSNGHLHLREWRVFVVDDLDGIRYTATTECIDCGEIITCRVTQEETIGISGGALIKQCVED